MPILIYKKDTAFLWKKEPFILAMIGGVRYCITAYSAFHYVPAAHAAIFLNGCIPLCTAVAAYLLFRQPFDRQYLAQPQYYVARTDGHEWADVSRTGIAFSLGDGLFFLSAVLWVTFTVLLRQWKLSAWHSMAGVAIWAAIIFVPIYVLFLPKTIAHVQPVQLIAQVVFHGVFVVIVATLTYVEAIKRLGAFKTGSIVTFGALLLLRLLRFLLLNEPLSVAILCGLVGMGDRGLAAVALDTGRTV